MQKTYISESELWRQRGYHKVYQWPGIEHTKKLRNSYLVREIARNSNLVHFELCPVVDYYGDVSLQDISCEKDGLISHVSFSKFLYLISKEYATAKEIKEKLDYDTKIKEFVQKLDEKSLTTFAKQITREYWTEFFRGRVDVSVLDMDKLAVSAIPNFIEFFYTLETQYNYQEIFDTSEGEGESESGDSEIDSDDQKDQGQDQKEKDNDREELYSFVQGQMFYDYYPLFQVFAKDMSNLSKDEIPNGDCLCGSTIDELNMQYGNRLVDYLRQNIKK